MSILKRKYKTSNDSAKAMSPQVAGVRNWEFENKIMDLFSKFESKLNALQLHLGIEIVEKTNLITKHKIIKTEEK